MAHHIHVTPERHDQFPPDTGEHIQDDGVLRDVVDAVDPYVLDVLTVDEEIEVDRLVESGLRSRTEALSIVVGQRGLGDRDLAFSGTWKALDRQATRSSTPPAAKTAPKAASSPFAGLTARQRAIAENYSPDPNLR